MTWYVSMHIKTCHNLVINFELHLVKEILANALFAFLR